MTRAPRVRRGGGAWWVLLGPQVHWFWQFEDTTSLTMEQHHMTHMSTTNYQVRRLSGL